MKDAPELNSRANHTGQSLVEFVVIAPLLITIMLSAFAIGMAIHQAGTASSSLQQVPINKAELAEAFTSQAVSQTLVNIANVNPNGLPGGSTSSYGLDQLEIVDPTSLSAVLVGVKRYNLAGIPFTPPSTMDFKVTQAVNGSLLMPNEPSALVTSSSGAGFVFPIQLPLTGSPPLNADDPNIQVYNWGSTLTLSEVCANSGAAATACSGQNGGDSYACLFMQKLAAATTAKSKLCGSKALYTVNQTHEVAY